MKVKAKIIKYYIDENLCNNNSCCSECDVDYESCSFVDKEIIYIDKEYKKCRFYKNRYGIFYLELGNKVYKYDEVIYENGGLADCIFEYIFIDNELIFGEYINKNIKEKK